MRWLRPAVVLGALALFAALLSGQWQEVQALARAVRPLPFALSFAAVVPLFFLDAWGWHLILTGLGLRVDARVSVAIWMLSAAARYLPGGIWGYTSRAAIARHYGLDLGTVGMSLYVETVLLLLSALAVGLPALAAASGMPFGPGAALTAMLGLGLLLHPRVLALCAHLPGRAGALARRVKTLSLRQVLALYAFYLMFWLIFAAVFVLFAFSIHPPAAQHWLVVGSALPLAFSVGFAIVFVPGGLGVRESVLYVALAPVAPAPVCALVSVGSRVWLLAAEALALVVAVLAARGAGPVKPP